VGFDPVAGNNEAISPEGSTMFAYVASIRHFREAQHGYIARNVANAAE
jgi:hypothetical protein